MKKQFTFLTLCMCFMLSPVAVLAQATTAVEHGKPEFSLDMVFTFLFLTLGPLKIIQPFWMLTRDRDVGFRNKLAVSSTLIALGAAFLATTVGAKILMKWQILPAAIALTAGVLLFLIALKAVMRQYGTQQPEESQKPDVPAPSASQMAFSPLAFPTIVTPYGIALLIALATLSPGQLFQILVIATIILVLNFLAMLAAGHIMKWSMAVALLGILGSVMGVLQVALGVQTILKSLYILELKV